VTHSNQQVVRDMFDIVRDGQIAECWPLIGDLYSFDDFWS